MKGQKRTPLTYGNPLIEAHVRRLAMAKHRAGIHNATPIIDACTPVKVTSLSSKGLHGRYLEEQMRVAKNEDMKMVDTITRTMKRPFSLPPKLGPTSLNYLRRNKDLHEINRSNLSLLSRLDATKSQYGLTNLQDHIKNSKRYSDNSSFYRRNQRLKIRAASETASTVVSNGEEILT